MSEYTPTTKEVRGQYAHEEYPHVRTVSEKRAEFDRWLAQVRADERERIAEEIQDSVPYGYGMNPDGTEDALAAAYAYGVRDAYLIVKGEPTDSEES